MAPGPDRQTLAAAGVIGWVCVPTGSAGIEGVLGFDLLRAPLATRPRDLGLLRVAADAIANAVDRERLERERGRLEGQLHQARRMETVGALANGIAHNFNNIVGAILGHAEMLETRRASDGGAGSVAAIRRSGERGRDLVEQIMAYGRPQKAARGRVALGGLVAETHGLLQASLPAGVEVALQQSGAPAHVAGDPAQLQQVILNLCANAAQAMDDSGRIEIAVAARELATPRRLSHGELPAGAYVRIAVSDAGRGMDDQTLGRIFEPFFTTRASGNGLGLATVREIVRQHGGALDVASRPGAGSRFAVWLPALARPDVPDDEAGPALLRGDGQIVMLVESEREQLLRSEDVLAALSYEPVGFAHAADALAAARAAPQRFDAVILGAAMPDEAALDLAAALHASLPGVPLVLATASTQESAPEAAGGRDLRDRSPPARRGRGRDRARPPAQGAAPGGTCRSAGLRRRIIPLGKAFAPMVADDPYCRSHPHGSSRQARGRYLAPVGAREALLPGAVMRRYG